MSSLTWHYTYEELVSALRKVGIISGDTVFIQLSLGMLGRPEGCSSIEEVSAFVYRALRQVVGNKGTILVGTFTYSFGKGEVFDIQETPSAIGPFTEYFRLLPGTFRSADPMMSVAGTGVQAKELLSGLPCTSFGRDCVYDRLIQAKAKICMVGVDLDYSILRHHAEEIAQVPFRFKKIFRGLIKDGKQLYEQDWIYFVRLLATNAYSDGTRLAKKARELKLCLTTKIGRGEILSIDSRALYDLTIQELEKDPWYTARGPAGDPLSLEIDRVSIQKYAITLPRDCLVEKTVDTLWKLPRYSVSDAYETSLELLSHQYAINIHTYPTGTQCGNWVVPEKWTCRDAFLETLGGVRLLSVGNHPLHVASCSASFSGEVSREHLLAHLYTHSEKYKAIPLKSLCYENTWGLCCSRDLRKSLTENRYRVEINTSFSYGLYQIGESVVHGKNDSSIVLCCHLGVPSVFNEGLSGVIVGLEVIKKLRSFPQTEYTYRLLILPNPEGWGVFAENHRELLPQVEGVVFLDMLGDANPYKLKLSIDGATRFDQRVIEMVNKMDEEISLSSVARSPIPEENKLPNYLVNDIPLLSLTRVGDSSGNDWPYAAYRSSADSPNSNSIKVLKSSRDAVLRMIQLLDQDSM